MYQQYRKVKDSYYTLVSLSKNRKDDNDMIVKQKTEEGMSIDEILSQFVFDDWQKGDILLVAYSTIVHPFMENGELREATILERVLGGETELLQDGEYISRNKIVKVDKPTNMLKPTWNKATHKWEESATPEEIKQQFVNDINSLKSSVIYGPYEYKHTDGKTYHQKMRIGKDDSLIDGTVSVLTRHPEQTVVWSFDDNNNNVVMTLQDMLKLNDLGFIWIQAVYEAERVLKDGEPKVGLTKEEFKNLAISKLQHSFIK